MKGRLVPFISFFLILGSQLYSQPSFESKIYYQYFVGYNDAEAKYTFYSANSFSAGKTDSLLAKSAIKIVDTMIIVLQSNFNFACWGGETKVLPDLYSNKNDKGRKKVLYQSDSLRLIIWYDRQYIFIEQSSVVSGDKGLKAAEENKTRDIFMDLWMLGLTALGIAVMLF